MTLEHGGNLHKLAEMSGRAVEDIIDFSANINPLGPPESLRSVISRAIERLPHYPDPAASGLVAALSAEFAVPAERLVLGNGSTEIIYALPRALGRPRVVLPVPSYADYDKAARLAGLEVEPFILQEENDFAVDWQALEDRLQGNEIVVCGQPNNPTGIISDPAGLQDLVSNHPDTIFVIDESFADFVSDYQSVGRIDGPDNLIMVRSLTKFYAMAGLRLGFAVLPAALADSVRSYILPWSVNTLAQAVGTACLADREYGRRTREFVAARRRELHDRLVEIPGLKVFPGAANYLLVKLANCELDAAQLAEKLLDRGIAIRVCDNFIGLDRHFFRLAVRTKEENNRLCDAVLSLLAPRLKPRKFSKKTPALMLQGTTSNAGKSVLTAAFCRILLQDGLRVAPFKAQNMSLNSFVTRDGLEMGRAQVVQAQACRLDPDIRMNPVLLKPASDVGSQVIVNGRPVGNMSVAEYIRYKPTARKAVRAAYDDLAAENDIIVLEGAGSPAEINLKPHDIVNMAMAGYADAKVLLAGDIDRGGVFAAFVGTMELLTEPERALVKGFIVNRFRGQASLLDDAFIYTEQHTGRPVLGTIPYLSDLGLPEEDSVSFKAGLYDKPPPTGEHVEIALIDLPHISNFTDIEPFLAEPDVGLRIVRSPADLAGSGKPPAAVILPGSKNVINDLAYLAETGLAELVQGLAAGGETEIIGICGGFQMLGDVVADPHGLESGGGTSKGLGLLALKTTLARDKTLTRQIFAHQESGQPVHGYEIHHGETKTVEKPLLIAEGRTAGAVSGNGLVWGTYLHGIFDADGFRRWFIDRLRQRRGLIPLKTVQTPYDLEPALERLAGIVREHVDLDRIYRMLKL